MTIDISIIIPVFKAKETLNSTLNSIINQKFKNLKPNIEIILSIDDCMDYRKIIGSISNKIKIKLIRTKKIATGPGNARNEGYKHSKGKYICFLDADDEYSENYLE